LEIEAAARAANAHAFIEQLPQGYATVLANSSDARWVANANGSIVWPYLAMRPS